MTNAPKIELPKEVIKAFERAGVLQSFYAFAPSHQREYWRYIDEAKKPETRQRRTAKVIEMIKAKLSK